MITVSTAELKTHLGRYLHMVRRGEIINVTSHSHSVARLVPSSPGSHPDIIPPTRPVGDLRALEEVPLQSPADGVAMLLEDRTNR